MPTARFYADPEFGHVPTDWLISKDYARQRRGLSQMDRALVNIEPGDPQARTAIPFISVPSTKTATVSR